MLNALVKFAGVSLFTGLAYLIAESDSTLADDAALLPSKLQWQTASNPPSLASPQAKPGGQLIASLYSFPLTLRQVGPDSADSFRRLLDENDMSLVSLHPNTEQWIPMLATHWAFGSDGRTVYYRLNPAARWSDGQAVSAADYVYTQEFMRSPHIQSPWANQYYSKTIESIRALRDPKWGELIAIRLAQTSSELLYMTNIKPTPKHFYGSLDASFTSKFNWLIPPNLGPYVISKIEKGQRIVFSKKVDWWAKDMPYFKHRYNVEQVIFKLVRDQQIAYEYLKAGELDILALSSPEIWRQSQTDEAFSKRYVQKLQAYNDLPRSDYGIILNSKYGPFQDKKVREAFAFAMNVQRVIDELLKDGYQRLQGLSQGYGAFTHPLLRARPFDLKKADALLKEAGWAQRNSEGIRVKDGKTLTASLIYSQASMTPRFIILQDDARKAGFDMKLQLMDQGLAFQYLRDKKHELGFFVASTGFRPEYRSRFHSSLAMQTQNLNFSNTASPVLDQLIEEYEHASDDRKRIEKAHAIQEFVFHDACYVPLFEVPYYRVAFGSWVQFPEIPSTKGTDGLSFFDSATGGLFWIDGEKQKAVLAARRRGESLPARTWIDESFRVKK